MDIDCRDETRARPEILQQAKHPGNVLKSKKNYFNIFLFTIRQDDC